MINNEWPCTCCTCRPDLYKPNLFDKMRDERNKNNINGEPEMAKTKKPTPEVKPRKLTPKQMAKKITQLEQEVNRLFTQNGDLESNLNIKKAMIERLQQQIEKGDELLQGEIKKSDKNRKIIDKMFSDLVEISHHFDFNKPRNFVETKVGEIHVKTESTSKSSDYINDDRRFGRIEGAVEQVFRKWSDFRRDGGF